jgi:folate-binding protein YgfZ
MADFLAEYNAALTSAALFDCSDAAKIELTGPDAAMFLGNLCTNDIKNLPPGSGCPAFFCDPRAKVKFQAWIGRADLPDGTARFWVETTPGRNAELFKYLDRYLISERVEIHDRTDEFAQFHLAGPTAKRVSDEAGGGPVRPRELLGLPGFDVVVPVASAGSARQRLTDAGATPASREVFETLRIEAGTPLFGPDIDENRFVMEVAHAARAVSYTKGCYLGQEPIVMARDRAGHVNRAFSAVKVLQGGPLPPGTKLLRDGQEVGVVTSSCHSPRLGAPVALGYLRWKHQDVGTRMEAETPTGRHPVEVLGMPPVKSS